MLENLDAFRQRTAFVWDSLPREGSFATNPRLLEKVSPGGRLIPFYGDTVIFDLSDEDKGWLRSIQSKLYCCCFSLLAEPLGEDSFHITLHDLNSAPRREDVAQAMARSGAAARELLKEQTGVIRVRATAAFSMVNTSVVLGFEPAEEDDCAALMALYERFQGVVKLNYPLTPHVTLAYYRPGDYGEEGLRKLRGAIETVNRDMEQRTLRLLQPVYCTFSDMKSYQVQA